LEAGITIEEESFKVGFNGLSSSMGTVEVGLSTIAFDVTVPGFVTIDFDETVTGFVTSSSMGEFK